MSWSQVRVASAGLKPRGHDESPIQADPSHHAAFRAISAVAPRFVHRSVHNLGVGPELKTCQGGSGPPGPASPSAVSAPLPWRPKFCRVRDCPSYDRSFDRNPCVGQSTYSSAGQSRLRAPTWLSKNSRRGEHAAPPSADAFSSPTVRRMSWTPVPRWSGSLETAISSSSEILMLRWRLHRVELRYEPGPVDFRQGHQDAARRQCRFRPVCARGGLVDED